VVGPEGQRVAPQHPLDADEAQDEEAVHDRREDVLAPDETAVEEPERRGHEHDEGGRDQEPRGVAGVDLLHARQSGRGACPGQRRMGATKVSVRSWRAGRNRCPASSPFHDRKSTQRRFRPARRMRMLSPEHSAEVDA
jgi:hypothetical protein